MADIEKFIFLFESVGIHCQVLQSDNGNYYFSLELQRDNLKLKGYSSCYTVFEFDKEGNFLYMSFLEL